VRGAHVHRKLEATMKVMGRYLLAALALALVGGVCLALATVDRRMVRVQQSLATMNYPEAQATLATTQRYFDVAGHLPWIGDSLLNQQRARQAALLYWQRQYGSIVPRQADPLEAVAANNIELQLVVADAVYRAGQAQSKDRQTTLQVLSGGIAAYLTVLKNSPRQEDAAYNYEYLVRLRDDINKGRRAAGPSDVDGPNGREGAPPDKNKDNLRIYVPLQQDERDRNAGSNKSVPAKRRG
jgi:hypothetical protein